MFNLNLIDTIDQYSMSQEDRLKFITTFNSISVTGIKIMKFLISIKLKKHLVIVTLA